MTDIIGDLSGEAIPSIKEFVTGDKEGSDKGDSGMDDDTPSGMEEDTPCETESVNQVTKDISNTPEGDSEDEAVIKIKPKKKKPVIFDDEDDDSCETDFVRNVNPEENHLTEKKLTAEEVLMEITEDNNEPENLDSDDEAMTLSTVLSSKKKSRIKKSSFLGDDDDEDDDKDDVTETETKETKMTYDTNIFDAETDSDEDSNSGHSDEGYNESEGENQPISDQLKARLKKGASKKPSTRARQKAEKENIQDLHSETQRLIRESRVNIPYHEPKPKSLNDFLSRAAEKQASIKSLRGAAGFRSVSWYEEKERQREKRRQEEKERKAKEMKNIETKNLETNCEMEISKLDDNQDKSTELSQNMVENIDKVTGKTVKQNEEDFDTLPDLFVEVDKNNEKFKSEKTEDVDELPDLDCDFSSNKETIVNNHNSSEPTGDKAGSVFPICTATKTDTLNTSGIELFEDIEEGVVASVISPAKCMNSSRKQTKVDLSEEKESDNPSVLQNENPGTPQLNASKNTSSLTPKLMALSTVDLQSITPKLSGSPDTVISFDEDGQSTPQNPGVRKLMSRFLQHSQKKKTPQSKDHSISVVQKEKGDHDKEELKLSTVIYHSEQPEDTLKTSDTPGGKLMALKEQLSVQMRLKREEARQKRVEMYQLDNEEGYNEGVSDEEEAELTDGSDTESDGDYKPGDAVEGAEDDGMEDEDAEEVEDEEEREENPLLDDAAEVDDDDDDDEAVPNDDSDDDGVEGHLKLALSDGEESQDQVDKDVEDEDVIKHIQKGKKPRALAISDDEDSKDIQVDETNIKTKDDSDNMDVSFNSDTMTPFTKHISMTTQPESFSCKKLSRPLSLPVEDSQDLYSNSTVDSIPVTQSDNFLSDDIQSQMLDADGFLKVNSTLKKPKQRPASLKSSHEESTMDELLGLCSGRFTDPSTQSDAPGDKRTSRSLFSQIEMGDDNAQTGAMDELLGLCSGKFTESTQQMQPTQRKVIRPPVDSDDESETSFKLLSDDDEDKENIEDKDELESDEEGERSVGQQDEDNKLMPAPGFKTLGKKGKIRREFIEDEAELSGSEYDSDENLDLAEEEDIMMVEEGDKDVQLSEEELRNQVGRVHMKKVLDDDHREMRLLQEMYLPDGDLHSDGKGRTRRFRWSHVDEDTQEDMFGVGSDEEGAGEEDAEADSKWRMERHEREKWIQQQQQENENDENSNSQFMKFGKLILKQKNKPDQENISKESPTVEREALQPKPLLPAHPKLSSQKRGSFLSRGKDKLAKIAELTKTGVNTNSSRNSQNFVFKPLSPESELKAKMKPPTKRPLGTPTASQPPSAKRPKTTIASSFSQNSIFKHL